MPNFFPYLSNFLGEEPDEDKKPQEPTRLNLPPEVLQQMGFTRQPTEEELEERKNLEEAGVQFIDFTPEPPEPQTPQQKDVSTLSPYGKERFNQDKILRQFQAQDKETGKPLKIERIEGQVGGDVAPTITEDDIPDIRPLELKQEPINSTVSTSSSSN